MNVVRFPSRLDRAPDGWHSAEVQRLVNACAAYVPHGVASGWEFGVTERGDPQMYLLGPEPEQDCILSISRLGRLYVLEDGNGRVIFEHNDLMRLAEQATNALKKKKEVILGQIALAWIAMREFYEEKIEPVMAEPVELLTHFAPQLAALT
jgi:hypothetical protein